jgi:Glycine zipper 2TM domain
MSREDWGFGGPSARDKVYYLYKTPSSPAAPAFTRGAGKGAQKSGETAERGATMTKLIMTMAAALALPFAVAPAFAQYGGNPDDPQVALDGDGGKAAGPGPAAQAPTGKEDQADVDDDVDVDVDADADTDADTEDGAYDDADGPAPDAAGAPADEGEEYSGDTWRDGDGRLHCRRSDGTTGLIVGGGAGALVGRGIDRHGERATGTIIGAVAGALVGRAVEQSARCQAETRNR